MQLSHIGSTSNLVDTSLDEAPPPKRLIFSKWWNDLFKYRMKITVCCPLVTILIIAMLVMLAIMAIYGINSQQVIINTQTVSTSYSIIYGTNTKIGYTLNVLDTKGLANNLMKTIGLTGITVNNAQLIPLLTTNSTKKRQVIPTNIIQCQKNPNTTGDFLILTISINYPQDCAANDCRKLFDIKVQNYIDTLYTNMSF
ncbi:unnamed protein product, partial [Adineta steineri]